MADSLQLVRVRKKTIETRKGIPKMQQRRYPCQTPNAEWEKRKYVT
jgi:hypothetical protein